MKELSGIEKLELVKATMEGLGFDFSEMGAGNAFEMFRKIKKAVSDTLAEQMERDALFEESLAEQLDRDAKEAESLKNS